jgi:hypothetical protein
VKHQATVYFDTCFYVWLCRADDSLAAQTINALNSLNVRHVISNVLLRELLTCGNKPDSDRTLVRRVRQFSIAPYHTEDGLMWEALLFSGRERSDYADFLTGLHDMMTKADSLSIMAERATGEEETAKLLEANQEELQDLGFPADFQQDVPQVLSAFKGMLGAFGMNDLEVPDNPTNDDLRKLSGQILERGRQMFGQSLFDQVEEQRRIRNSSTETEDRPYQVATDSASGEVKKRLGNTLRDVEHIALFAHHRDEIDFLQVDSKHEKILRRDKPPHRLAKLGLLDRCFSAPSLSTVVDRVQSLIQSGERR